MKTKTSLFSILFFSLLFLIPHLLFSQTHKPKDFRKFGVGIGFNTNSVIVDSLRPIEISLRYRIDDKHSLQIYSPLAIKSSTEPIYKKKTNKEHIVGLGLAYDYSFYSFSSFNLFAGVAIDYTWYQSRSDFQAKYLKFKGKEGYMVEETSFRWQKIRNASIIPHIGLRLHFLKFTAEAKIELPFSYAKRDSYSYAEHILPYNTSTWETFGPKINMYSVQRNASVNISYYF